MAKGVDFQEPVLCTSELGMVPHPKEDQKFMQSLKRYLKNYQQVDLYTVGWKLPRLGGADINLATLYRSVIRGGGYKMVTHDKGTWKHVTEDLHLPSSVTNGSYMVRNYYEKFLLNYERRYFKSAQNLGPNRQISAKEKRGILPKQPATKGQSASKGATAKGNRPPSREIYVPNASIPKTAQELAYNSAQKAAMEAHKKVQNVFSLISPSIGPYMVVPPSFEISEWDNVIKALSSSESKALGWSLNVLAIVAQDNKLEVLLQKLPGLLEALLTIINRALIETPIENKASKLCSDRELELNDKRKDESKSYWWELEHEGIIAPTEDTFHTSMFAVAASGILRNLSFKRANMEFMASIGQCIHCLTNCITPETVERLGSDGERLRFASLDTLCNIGSSMSLPKLGVVGRGLMQALTMLLGAPVMSEKFLEEEMMNKSAILAADLLSQLSLGTENASTISELAATLGLYAWLTAHLNSKNSSLTAASVAALNRLANLPGSEARKRLIHQRWTLKRLVHLATATGNSPNAAIFEAASLLRSIATDANGREQLQPYLPKLMSIWISDAKQNFMIGRTLSLCNTNTFSSKSKKQKT